MHDKESHDVTLGSSSPVHRFWAGRGQRPSNLPPWQKAMAATERILFWAFSSMEPMCLVLVHKMATRPKRFRLCSCCSLVALIRPHCPCFSFWWFVYIWPPTYGPVVIVMARSLSKGPANAVLAATKHAQQALLSSTLKMTTETGTLSAVEWCDTEALDANESGVAVSFFPSPAKEPTLMFYV